MAGVVANFRTSPTYFDLLGVAALRFRVVVLGAFAAIALLLTFVGVYGVTSYAAARRVQEVGVRMALGATRADIVRVLLKQALKPVVSGVIAGLLGAVVIGRLLIAHFHEVHAASPWVFTAVLLAVAATALLASLIPSLRASAADPTAALRPE